MTQTRLTKDQTKLLTDIIRYNLGDNESSEVSDLLAQLEAAEAIDLVHNVKSRVGYVGLLNEAELSLIEEGKLLLAMQRLLTRSGRGVRECRDMINSGAGFLGLKRHL